MSETLTVRAPASYVAPNAIAYGAIDSDAVAVDALNPLPTSVRSFRYAESVSPSNAAPLPLGPADDLFIGTGGTVTVALAGDGREVTFKNVVSGSRLGIGVRRVAATGTTAQDIVALYYAVRPTSPADDAPLPIPAKIELADFSTLSALYSPDAALTDAASSDNPSGAASALRLTTSGSTDYFLASGVLDTPVDTRTGSLHIPLKPIDGLASNNQGNQTFSAFSLQLFSAGSPANPPADYHQIDPTGAGPGGLKALLTNPDTGTTGRWQTFGVPTTQLSQVGAGADLSAVTWARVRVRGQDEYAQTVEFGSPAFQPNPLDKAKAIVFFDDLYSEIFDIARPLFAAKGWAFSFNGGALQANIDQPGRLTLAQCRQLVAEGHHMMLQAWSSESAATIDSMDDAERAAEMQAQIDYMFANGLMATDDPIFGSYFSQVGPSDMTAFPMFRDVSIAGTRTHFLPRGGNPPLLFGESFPWPDRHMVRSIAADRATPDGFREAHVRQAIDNKGVAMTTWHQDMTTLAGYLDYLATQDIEVVSAKQLLRRYR